MMMMQLIHCSAHGITLIIIVLILPCFFFQLPIKVGHQNTHTKVSTEHNKECLINISKYKFSLVISGLTTILKNVNNMVSGLLPSLCVEQEMDRFYSFVTVERVIGCCGNCC